MDLSALEGAWIAALPTGPSCGLALQQQCCACSICAAIAAGRIAQQADFDTLRDSRRSRLRCGTSDAAPILSSAG